MENKSGRNSQESEGKEVEVMRTKIIEWNKSSMCVVTVLLSNKIDKYLKRTGCRHVEEYIFDPLDSRN